MLRVTVSGGTEAGRKVVRDRQDWRCLCAARHPLATRIAVTDPAAYRQHPGDRYSCPDCGARRP